MLLIKVTTAYKCLSNLVEIFCFVFSLLRSVIGPENSRHHLNQSNAKLKLIQLGQRVFPPSSRAIISRHHLAPSSRAIISTNQMQNLNQSQLGQRVFPRFKQVASFYFEFSLIDDDVNLCSDAQLWLVWF